MRVLVTAACVGVGLLTASVARAVDRDGCAIPYEQAQRLRNQRVFSAAREQLETCKARCPGVLSADCSRWIAELATLTPTVTFVVHDADGRRAPSFHVSVDGTLQGEAPGRGAVPVDPGAHVFRVEAPGFRPAEVRATLNEGEHDRVVDVTVVAMGPAASVPSVAPPSAVAAAAPPAGAATIAADASASHPPLAYALGATGIAALATGGALAIVGFADRAHLSATCSPRCTPARVDAVSTLWTAAAITSAAGAAALAAGTVLWLRRAPRGEAARAPWWTPTIGLGSAGVAGEF